MEERKKLTSEEIITSLQFVQKELDRLINLLDEKNKARTKAASIATKQIIDEFKLGFSRLN